MGMGRDILGRKQVAALSLLCAAFTAAAGIADAQEARVDPGKEKALGDFRQWAMVPFSPLPQADAAATGQPPAPPMIEGPGELVAFSDATIPPLQGHMGPELRTLASPEEAAVAGFVRIYLGRKAYLQGVLGRIPIYRIPIGAVITRLELPRELLYLPALESGFQPRAMSPAGAAGLWQLMTNTASPSGLRTDAWLDERKDFIKATEVSLKKLKYDRSVFGDWYMALAAYNCGAARLSRIVKESGIRDYWTLRKKGLLPRETASFVPAFLALSRICGYPGRYGLEPGWTEAVEWETVKVDRSVDLEILARLSGVPYDLLRAGNSELLLSVTPPASYAYSLKVPAGGAEAVRAVLENPSGPLVELSIHVVKAGDTLSGIAQAYGVPLAWVVEQNPAVRPQTLQIGSRILVPKTTGTKPSAAAGQAPTQGRRG